MKAHDWEDMKEQTCRPVVLHCKVLMTVSDAGRLPLKPLSLVAVIPWDCSSMFILRLTAFMASTSRISADGPCTPLTSYTLRTLSEL